MTEPSKSSKQNVTFFNPAYMSKDEGFDWDDHMIKYCKGYVKDFDEERIREKCANNFIKNKKTMMKYWEFDQYKGLCLSPEDGKIYNSWRIGDPREKHNLKWFRMVDGKKVYIYGSEIQIK